MASSTTSSGIRVLRTRAELREALASAPRPVGLVPTMGWLQDGHRALIRRASTENATTVVSIFVNPRQFGDPTDLDKYPRSEARDIALCTEEGVDLVFAPSVEEVYPPGFDTTVKVGAVAEPLEGAARPAHFDGVATVVAILLDLVGEEPLAKPEYVSVADTTTLKELDTVAGPALLSLAVRFGSTRLIDNQPIE